MSTEQLIIAAITVAFAAFVQGSSGLGFALIVAPVLTLVQPELLPVTVLFLMLPLNAYVALRTIIHRRVAALPQRWPACRGDVRGGQTPPRCGSGCGGFRRCG